MNNNYGYDFKNDSEKEENSERMDNEMINDNIYSNQNYYNYNYNRENQSNPINDNYGYNRNNNITGDNKEFYSPFEIYQNEMDYNKFENNPKDEGAIKIKKDDYSYNNTQYIPNPNYDGNFYEQIQRIQNENRDFGTNKIRNQNNENRRNIDINYNTINTSNVRDRDKLSGVIKEENEEKNNDNNNKMDDPLSLFEGLGRRRRVQNVSPDSIKEKKNDNKSN